MQSCRASHPDCLPETLQSLDVLTKTPQACCQTKICISLDQCKPIQTLSRDKSKDNKLLNHTVADICEILRVFDEM